MFKRRNGRFGFAIFVVLLISPVLMTGPMASSTEEPKVKVVYAGRLIDAVTTDVRSNVSVIIENDRIREVQNGKELLVLTLASTRMVRTRRSSSSWWKPVAWMNLNGHDVRLELVKTTLWRRRRGNVFAQYEYREGRIQITVSLPQDTDYIFGYRAKIVLRKGRAVRTIDGFGLPQCD
jgi:hypothetical protein